MEYMSKSASTVSGLDKNVQAYRKRFPKGSIPEVLQARKGTFHLNFLIQDVLIVFFIFKVPRMFRNRKSLPNPTKVSQKRCAEPEERASFRASENHD
jgi:hypothetical protein